MSSTQSHPTYRSSWFYHLLSLTLQFRPPPFSSPSSSLFPDGKRVAVEKRHLRITLPSRAPRENTNKREKTATAKMTITNLITLSAAEFKRSDPFFLCFLFSCFFCLFVCFYLADMAESIAPWLLRLCVHDQKRPSIQVN